MGMAAWFVLSGASPRSDSGGHERQGYEAKSITTISAGKAMIGAPTAPVFGFTGRILLCSEAHSRPLPSNARPTTNLLLMFPMTDCRPVARDTRTKSAPIPGSGVTTLPNRRHCKVGLTTAGFD